MVLPLLSKRSRLRPVLLLALGLVLVDAVVVSFRDTWQRHSPDDYAERLRGCQSRPHDFVFAGGSPVSEGLDPAVVSGVRWRGAELRDGYAIGLHGGTTSDVYHALRHGCVAPPKLIVYGLTASDMNDSRHEPHGPYSLMSWGDLFEWWRARPESTEWMTRHFLQGRLARAWAVFRYRHGIRMWAAMAADGYFPGCCPESLKDAQYNLAYSAALRDGDGYAPDAHFVNRRYDLAKQAGWVAPPFPYLDKYRTGAHLTYLRRLADWAAGQGTDLVLLDMPVTADLEARYPAPLAEYRRRLAELEAEGGWVVLRGSRQAVGLDDRHFADLIHLNRDGAEKLSAWLRGQLAAGGTRP